MIYSPCQKPTANFQGTDPKDLELRILTALANDPFHSILQYLQFLFSSPLQHTRQPTAFNH